MTFPVYEFPNLPTTTIVPQNEDLFTPYLSRVYEDIAFAVNEKDNSFYPSMITSTPTNILNLPNFGAFVICISGETTSLPTITASLCKSSVTAAGSVAVLGSQAGTGSWSGNALTITAAASNFQVAHDRAGVSGNFNIRIIGTQ